MTASRLRTAALFLAAATIAALAPPHTARSGRALAAEPAIAHVQKEESPIAGMVIVPPGATTYYLSGMVAPVSDPSAPKGTMAAYGDTKTQTIGALTRIKEALAEQKLGLGDVVKMTVFLAGDPALDGRMDFAGMMEGYKQFFGTVDQPNKPARSTVQVANLVGPGMMVEIEVVAAK
jgi:enamine deaminase RidA (YjgF/YER057c/UK114 family)